jgi:hypothetical protein
VIGDALARVFARLGFVAKRQNHVGDWGLPIAMVAQRIKEGVDAGALKLDALTLDDLDGLYKEAQRACRPETKALKWVVTLMMPSALASVRTASKYAIKLLCKSACDPNTPESMIAIPILTPSGSAPSTAAYWGSFLSAVKSVTSNAADKTNRCSNCSTSTATGNVTQRCRARRGLGGYQRIDHFICGSLQRAEGNVHAQIPKEFRVATESHQTHRLKWEI